MNAVWISWATAFVVIAGVVLGAGLAANGRLLGAFVDSRGRFSLSRLQFVLWVAVVVSMAVGVLTGRLLTRHVEPAAFNVPPTVLGLLAVSAGSAALAGAVKAYKNSTRAPWVAASPDRGASPAQLVLVEEGAEADRLVDVAKLQQLIVTVVLAVIYVGLGIHTFAGNGTQPVHDPGDLTSLPNFPGALLILLAISHGAYLAGKIPNRGTSDADRPGYTLVDRLSTADDRRQALRADEVAGNRRAARRLHRQRRAAELRDQAERADAAAARSAQTAPQLAVPAAEPYIGRARVVQEFDEDAELEDDEAVDDQTVHHRAGAI